MDDAAPKKRVRVYVPGEWKRRGRVDPRSKSRKFGRPFQKFVGVVDPVERHRLNSAWWRNSAGPVLRAWRFEKQRLYKSDVLFEMAVGEYADWLDAFDDELPPGIELSHLLWGRPLETGP
jgi:hypothetical protein